MQENTFDINQTLDASLKSIVYKIQLKNIDEILSIETNIEDNDLLYTDVKFSKDDYTYSYWEELSVDKLNTYDLTGDSFLKIRYTIQDPNNPIELNGITVRFTSDNNSEFIVKDVKPQSSIEVKSPNFDIYQKPDVAADLNQKLSKSVNEFFGLSGYYFKSDVISSDVFLHEHTMYELANSCGKQVKVLFDGNELPSKPMITPFGTTFEIPIEVHFDYTYFKEQFGDHVPSHGDIVFIPDTKAIWEVNGSNLERGIMNKPLYWSVTMDKYTPKANRDETTLQHDSVLDTLEESGYTVMTAEDVFGDAWKQNEEKVIKPVETRKDGVRQDSRRFQLGDVEINSLVKPVKEDIQNNHIIISHFNYDLSNVGYDDTALKYGVSYNSSGDITYSAWLKFPNIDNSRLLVRISDNTIYSSKYTETESEQILINKETDILYKTVIDGRTPQIVLPDGLYYLRIPVNVNVFNSFFITDNRYLKSDSFGLFEDFYQIEPDVWYNIIITISARFDQIGLYLYQLSPHTESLDLKKKSIIDKQIDNINLNDIVIYGGLTNVTNVRLFDEMLQEEHHQIVLNQQFVDDTNKAIIIDNVKPEFIQENYGSPL